MKTEDQGITDKELKEGSGGSRSIADDTQAVSAQFKPVMVEALQSSCDKITTHARRVGVTAGGGQNHVHETGCQDGKP